jgi:hypothetical protein
MKAAAMVRFAITRRWARRASARTAGRGGEVVARDHDVRGFECEVGSGAAHGCSDVSRCQGGAVADERHLRPVCLHVLDRGDFVLREEAGADVGDANVRCEPGRPHGCCHR